MRANISTLIENPEKFLNLVEELSQEERAFLAMDSLNSRTDWIDLLSVELKLRLQKQWKNTFSTPFNHSELWSLAKYRLKKIFQPALELSTGVSVFREPGMESTKAVIACADGKSKISKARLIQKMKVAEIHFDFVDLKKLKSAPWKCGSRNLEITQRTFDLPKNWKWHPTSFKPQDPQVLRVFASLGLVESIPKLMKEATLAYFRLQGNYELIHERGVHLRSEIEAHLKTTDVFMPLIDLPNQGNQFGFFNPAESGLLLELEKTLETPRGQAKILMTILLPPLKSKESREKLKNEKGTSFNQKQLAEIFAARGSPLVLVDLACFSKNFIKDWAPPFLLNKSHSDNKLPVIIGSKRGQRGEGVADILPQVEIILYALDQWVETQSFEIFKSSLDDGNPSIRHFNEILSYFEWMGMNPLEDSFQPVWSHDPPYSQLWTARNRSVIEIREDSQLKLYNPLPRL